MTLAIDLHHVVKVYSRKVHALRGITMQVERGEIFGLLGPNGAGKSTLVKILVTVVRPTRAEGHVLGQPIGHKPTMARIGYLPENHRFPRYLTGAQTVEYMGAMAGMERPLRRRRTAALMELVGMGAWAARPVSTYSKGMLQRTGLAAALVNDPELVFLDEPTDGVDPVGRREIRDVLLDLRRQGRTIFLNSHLLSELEMVCDRVAILVQGTVSSQGSIEQLTAASRRYEIVIEGDPPAWLSEHGGNAAAAGEGRKRLVFPGADVAAVQRVIDRLRADQRTIHVLQPVRESLEDLFMRAVTDPGTGAIARPGAALDTVRKERSP